MTQNMYSPYARTKLNRSYTFYVLSRFSVFLHFAVYSKSLLSALSLGLFLAALNPLHFQF